MGFLIWYGISVLGFEPIGMQLSGGQLPPPVQKLAASFRMAPQGNPAIEPYIVHHTENIRACSLLGACSDFLFIQRYYLLSLCPSGFALRRTGVWYIRRNTPVRYNQCITQRRNAYEKGGNPCGSLPKIWPCSRGTSIHITEK